MFLPWTELPTRSNITQHEFLEWLHRSAVAFGAPQLFVDAIDSLHDVVDQDEEVYELTKQRDALCNALEDLLSDPDDEDFTLAAEKILRTCTDL